MEEKFIEHVVFKRIMACGECDGGELIRTGHSRQNGQEMQYLHACTGCGRQVDLPRAYPDYLFIPIEQADEYRPAQPKRRRATKKAKSNG